MNDAEAGAIAHQLAPEISALTFNPDSAVADLSSFVSRVLGCTVGTANPSGTTPSPLLVQLTLAKKLQDIQATILNAKADHAQQVASAALNMASVATSTATSAATRSYAQTAAVPPPKAQNRPATQSPAAQDLKPTGTKAPPPPPLPLLPVPEARNLLQLAVLRAPLPKALHQPIHPPSADSSLP